jgi:uncharacterized protein DUF6084
VAELVFDCVGANADRYAAVPAIALRLRITETSGERVDAIALRCQIRIEPHRRRYSADEAARLHDLFGGTDRWADTLKPLQLATLSTMVPGFAGATTHELALPMSYDLEIASAKYFSSLEDGVIPLLMLYSGSVFSTRDGRLTVQQVPWSKESTFPLPVPVWREAVDLHFPNSAWFQVRRETLAALRDYKTRNALPTWDDTINSLLDEAAERES